MGSTKYQINYTANNFWNFLFYISDVCVHTNVVEKKIWACWLYLFTMLILPLLGCRCLSLLAVRKFYLKESSNNTLISFSFLITFEFWRVFILKRTLYENGNLMIQYINFSISKIIFNFHKHTQINMRKIMVKITTKLFHQRLKCPVFHISYKILIFYATQSLIDGSYWKKLFSLVLFFSCHEKSILFSQHVRRQTYIIHQCLRNWCCRRLYTLKVFTFHLEKW